MSSFVQISNTVRNQVLGFLIDPTIGFNPTLAAVCSDLGIASSAFTITTDFGRTANFFQGAYGYNDLAASSDINNGSAMCIYVTRSENNSQQKYHLFSGSVEVFIDTYVSFPQSRANPLGELLIDAVESTMYNIFHTTANQSFWGTVSYNGDLSTFRGPMALRSSNWLQMIRAKMTFDINAG